MRITNQMLIDRTTINLSNSINRLMAVENQLSTGRRINKASDDPIGTQHDLNYRARLREIEQYQSSIRLGTSSLSNYENDLNELSNMFSSAKEIALMMANDTYDGSAREAAALEIDSLLDQILRIGNNKVDGRYLYSGYRTHTKPLEASSNGVVYRGDLGQQMMSIDSDSRITTNMIGQDIFFETIAIPGKDADLEAGLVGSTLLSDLNMGSGVDLTSGMLPGMFAVYDQNRNITYSVDVSACTTIDEVVNAINDPLTGLPADSNLKIKLSESGASLTWEPVIGATNTVGDNTPLANLNEGVGVDMSLGKINIHNTDSSIDFEVDLSTASTLGETITLLEAGLDAALGAGHGITVGYNADGTGLQLSDTNGVPLDLYVDDIAGSESTLAADLGLTGSLDPDLVGGNLRPLPNFQILDVGSQTTAADLGIVGTIKSDTVGSNLKPILTTDTPLAALNNKNGFETGVIKISQGNRIAIVNLDSPGIVTVGDMLAAINGSGLDINARINDAQTGIQIEPTITGQTLIIEDGDLSQMASQLGLEGATDMLGSIMLLSNALHNNDRELAEQLVGTVDKALQGILVDRGTIGARISQMDRTLFRHEANYINFTKMLSDVEDADIIKLVTQLANEENLYQAALLASSKIIQPSLMDFLR